MKMKDKTDYKIAEYEKFPKSPTKEQLDELIKRLDVNPYLGVINAIREFHEKRNMEFDEEKYMKIYNKPI